jgi:tetratricopeptide (TPR) repeat protein
LARLNLGRLGGGATSVGYAVQVLARQPGNPLAQLTLVRGLLAQGDIPRAEREMQPLLKRFPNASAVQAQMGSVSLAKRDVVNARQYYERALAIDGNLVDAVAGLVMLDLAARRFDAAKSRVNTKLAERPDDVRLIELAARTAMASNDSPGAEAHLRRLIEVAPERLSAYGLLAQLYVRQQKLAEARAELTRLAAKQKRPVGAQTMIGMLYEQEKRPDEARKVYEQVLGYEPRAAVAANNLAWIMAESNDNLDVALKYAQTAKEVLPEQPEVSDTLAWVYYKKDLASLAVAPLQHAIERDPRNAVYHYRLGLVYLKTGDPAKARQSLQQALKLNPGFEQAADAKAKLGGL